MSQQTCVFCGKEKDITKEEMELWGVNESDIKMAHFKCKAERMKKDIRKAIKDFVASYVVQLASIKRTIKIEEERKELLGRFNL